MTMDRLLNLEIEPVEQELPHCAEVNGSTGDRNNSKSTLYSGRWPT
jgi:hypothetical protein